MPTVRLYYQDPYSTQFDAQVLRSMPGKKGAIGIVLDRTCFYPSSGGQPCDLGTLDGQTVFDVVEQETEIVHWVSGKVDGPAVHGTIDWARRFDHMQQHTGQHLLSQAFLRVLEAQTVSFHLGAASSTIDVDRSHSLPEEIASVEELANEVVFSDRPVTARVVAADELPTIDLRRDPTVRERIRVVQVEGFDASACGGTHVSSTGQVGPIAIRKWERRGTETRVEFLCGWRALRDHRWKTTAINELALAFSVKDRELPDAVTRLMQEAATARRELQHLREQQLCVEALQLHREARARGDTSVVLRAFEDREQQSIRRLASLVVEQPKTIALLGVSDAKGRLIFARSDDLAVDMADLLRQTCEQFGGGGGGQADMAQGGGLPGDRLGDALEWTYRTMTSE